MNKIFSIYIICLLVLMNPLSAQETKTSLTTSFESHTAHKINSTLNLEWIPLGPSLNGARAEAIQAHPDRPGLAYAAFGSGGLWKTVNNGLSWKPIFENFPALGIGDFAIAPSNPSVLYIGSGESLKKPRNFTMTGNGIYRSADEGETWQHLGLEDTRHIGEIVVHPENENIVLVAALGHFWTPNENRGIFRTEDGGKTWEHVLFINEKTGANDIVFSEANPNILYATSWENYPNVHGSKSSVYKSADAGKTWNEIKDGIHIDNNTGRIGIATSFQNSSKAYIFVDQRNRPSERGAGEIYVTENGGESWRKTHKSDIHALSVVGWYFMDIYVNPKDDNEIFGLGVRLLHSKDGGESFDFIGGEIAHLNPSPAQTLHLDHCELWINPENPNELWLANDGGVYHSHDKGESWLHLNNIPTGEFYDIELSQSEPYQIYGGTQDDATVVGLANEFNPNEKDPWKYLWIDAWSGGDGCITLVDPNDPNIVYFSMQNGAARRMDLAQNKSKSIRAKFPKASKIELEYNFISPYFLSPHNSNTMYMGSNYMLKSENRGDKWELISPNLIEERGKENEIAAGAIAESKLEEGLLYFGTDRGGFWVLENEKSGWTDRSAGLPSNYIRSIFPSAHNSDRVYVQLSGLNYDDLGAYLYVSEDRGESWKSIVGNLPNQPINVVVEDPFYEGVIYAGTMRGVYVSLDGGGHWKSLGNKMPDVSIGDIVIHESTKDLIVATHGRGIYKLNLTPFYLAHEYQIDKPYLFELPTSNYPKTRDTHSDIDKASLDKVNISFYLNDAQKVGLEVMNSQDSVLWGQEIVAKKGLNQFRWDKQLSQATSDKPYFINFNRYLKPGEYKIRLAHSTGVLTRKMIVID